MNRINLLGARETGESILETRCYVGLGSFVEGRAPQVGVLNGGNNYQGVQVGVLN